MVIPSISTIILLGFFWLGIKFVEGAYISRKQDDLLKRAADNKLKADALYKKIFSGMDRSYDSWEDLLLEYSQLMSSHDELYNSSFRFIKNKPKLPIPRMDIHYCDTFIKDFQNNIRISCTDEKDELEVKRDKAMDDMVCHLSQHKRAEIYALYYLGHNSIDHYSEKTYDFHPLNLPRVDEYLTAFKTICMDHAIKVLGDNFYGDRENDKYVIQEWKISEESYLVRLVSKENLAKASSY